MTFQNTYSWTSFLLNSSSALQMLCGHIKIHNDLVIREIKSVYEFTYCCLTYTVQKIH